MRDYKNVKVPSSYRGSANRKTVKRIDVRRAAGRTRADERGSKGVAMKIITVILIATIGWSVWQGYQALLHAELFQIAGVDVTGVKQVREAELRKIADVFTGQNIFRVDLETAVRGMRANPWVKDVRIYRRLPNRISMVVDERKAFALLDTSAGRYVMDSDGVVINRVARENATARQLPVLTIRDSPARSGEQVTSEVMTEALALLAEISERGGWPLHEVTIKAESPESISVLYADHEFKFGTGNYAEKVRRLGEIMSDVKQRGMDIAYVDLRPERQAAVMVKQNRIQGPGTRVKGKKI